ncbi:MAG TPA: hypothetical protein PK970_11780 [Hyphomicrobiaceae bacterium]|nr:hypothetical protein [Hyphomicrobiaceae bacterium]
MGETPLRIWHRLSALLIGTFIAVHIVNHVVGLAGQEQHVRFMAAARTVYRMPLVEATLLLALGWQIASGVVLLRRRIASLDGPVAWLQVASGAYLAFFLVVHVGAVLAGRWQGLDTDFRFAAAGFHVSYWPVFFAPYYALAVAALFTHIGCAAHWYLRRQGDTSHRVVSTFVATGVGLGIAVVLALAGVLYEVDIPAVYRKSFPGA